MIKTLIKYILFVCTLGSLTHGYAQKKKNKGRATSKEVASFSFTKDQDRKDFETHFFDAIRHKMNEDWDDELVSLNACLEVTDQVGAIYFEMANVYLQKEQNEEAVSYLEKARKLDGNNTWYMSVLANAYRLKYDFANETKLRAEILKSNPESEYNRKLYIESLQLNSEPKKAIEQLNVLERNFGIQPEYSYEKHRIYSSIKDWKSAEKEMLKLIETFPTEIDFKLALAEFYTFKKDNEKAKKTYESILVEHPGLGAAEYGLFRHYFELNELSNAEKYLVSALETGDLSAKEQLAIIHFAHSQYLQKIRSKDNLINLLEISIKNHPTQYEYYGYLGDLTPAEQPEKKVGYYKKALDIRPQYVIYNAIAEVYFLNENYDSTIVWTNNTLEHFEYRPEPYLIQAFSYFRKEMYEKSIESAENGIEYLLDNEKAKVPFYAIIGNSSNSLKNYKKSDEAYMKLLSLDPENIEALNNYSYFLSLRDEKLDYAEELILKVLNNQPNSSTYTDTYGWILYKQKKYEKALDQLLKALSLTSKPSAEMFEHVGDCYKALGKTEKALSFWKKALVELGDKPSSELDQKIKSNE
ncbi:MAG: tetratricopeptide repeat protein [Flavobacteriales bacterium]